MTNTDLIAADDRTERLPGPQVYPGAEDPTGRHADELVPGLGVDAAGDSGRRVERHVVLHRAEVGQPERRQLGTLPVLLEPAPVVASDVEVDHQQAGNSREVDGEFSHD